VEGHIPTAADEVDEHDRDGEVRQPDQGVGDVTEPDQLRTPPASEAAGREAGRVEESSEEVHGGPQSCGRSGAGLPPRPGCPSTSAPRDRRGPTRPGCRP
jgi:hypothetical protein